MLLYNLYYLQNIITIPVFLPRDAMHSAVLVIVNLSVCPSVSLFVKLVDCVYMVRPTITISSRYGSPMILVLQISGTSRNSKGSTPSGEQRR